jgi:hypothetical protein
MFFSNQSGKLKRGERNETTLRQSLNTLTREAYLLISIRNSSGFTTQASSHWNRLNELSRFFMKNLSKISGWISIKTNDGPWLGNLSNARHEWLACDTIRSIPAKRIRNKNKNGRRLFYARRIRLFSEWEKIVLATLTATEDVRSRTQHYAP